MDIIPELELPSLCERHEEQSLPVFTRMTDSVNCLHRLLPPQQVECAEFNVPLNT